MQEWYADSSATLRHSLVHIVKIPTESSNREGCVAMEEESVSTLLL